MLPTLVARDPISIFLKRRPLLRRLSRRSSGGGALEGRVEVMHGGVASGARSPRPQGADVGGVASASVEGSEAGDLELASGVAEDDLVGYGVEKLAAADGSRAATRRPLQVPLAAMDYIFQIRNRPRTT